MNKIWCIGLFFAVLFLGGCSDKDDLEPVAEYTAAEELTGMGGSDFSEPFTGDIILDMLNEPDPELFYTVYQVQKGDMIGVIAEHNGITQDSLISVNKIKQSRYIQIGQFLKVPSMSGILYTIKNNTETPESIAQKYEISAEKIMLVNKISPDGGLSEGMTLFLPDAKLDWVTRQEINGDLFRKPIRHSYYMSSPFGWRNSPFTGARTFHNGVDMASALSTPIYAALSGTVVASGYDTVYGNYVIVSHHSGYRTLYGHLSSRNVAAGKHVKTGDLIGRVGNTGLSTGPHLHFTIFKNNTAINPINLWN
ncbi:MAG: M23 family metallopeptidase [Spirochaetaceae bacterium]|jgi:murein DD-endopeptidase MepM/ murein hydrolase activator NlpD|nr:M23 family metallopeptidase [Spirochaetaceae bacterium]